MENKLPQMWFNNLEKLDIAFQPILNIYNGEIYGVEALLRNYQELGFKSAFSLFDKAYQENLLYTFDLFLREKTLQKFTKIKNFENIKLFYNLDNRLLTMPNFSNGNTAKLLKKYGVKKENICFEISERHKISIDYNLGKTIQHYRNENFAIAIDDFGVGYAGYKLLYDFTPNIIKIDRSFIGDINKNLKKKIMVRSITHLAIQLGIKVVAEGIETEEELFTCKEIGCHFVQGYFIQKPTRSIEGILWKYDTIIDLVKNDQREDNSLNLENYIDKIQELDLKTDMDMVIEYFKTNKNTPAVPIVNINSEPIGVLYESKIKDFLYSPYGMALLLNREVKRSKLKSMINVCGSADINSSISTIIELFSNSDESAGIIITKNSKYYGFLSSQAIINIMNEENMLAARDQNPLTRLPGNTAIEKYMSEIIQDSNSYLLCYYDLDNFKAFNDVYGFVNGDRVIQLFSDVLKNFLSKNIFKAHIGGDDFFTGIASGKEIDTESALNEIKNIINEFSVAAREFYSEEDRNRGFVFCENRESSIKKFPLLSVSASVLVIHNKTTKRSLDIISNILSTQKKFAKKNINHISISSLL